MFRLCTGGSVDWRCIGSQYHSSLQVFRRVLLIGNEGPSINLSLGKDGTATVAEDFGNGSETLFGHWTEIGDHITIIFDAAEASVQNPPMVLQFGHYGFRAVSWNHAAWGTPDPPPVKKGAYKVKQACLFPMNP